MNTTIPTNWEHDTAESPAATEDIRQAPRWLLLILAGAVLHVLELSVSRTVNGRGISFDFLNDIFGALLVLLGLHGLLGLRDSKPYRIAMMTAMAATIAWAFLDGMEVMIVPRLPEWAGWIKVGPQWLVMIGFVAFPLAMLYAARAYGLERSRRWWRAMLILMMVLVGLLGWFSIWDRWLLPHLAVFLVSGLLGLAALLGLLGVALGAVLVTRKEVRGRYGPGPGLGLPGRWKSIACCIGAIALSALAGAYAVSSAAEYAPPPGGGWDGSLGPDWPAKAGPIPPGAIRMQWTQDMHATDTRGPNTTGRLLTMGCMWDLRVRRSADKAAPSAVLANVRPIIQPGELPRVKYLHPLADIVSRSRRLDSLPLSEGRRWLQRWEDEHPELACRRSSLITGEGFAIYGDFLLATYTGASATLRNARANPPGGYVRCPGPGSKRWAVACTRSLWGIYDYRIIVLPWVLPADDHQETITGVTPVELKDGDSLSTRESIFYSNHLYGEDTFENIHFENSQRPRTVLLGLTGVATELPGDHGGQNTDGD